MTSPTRDKSVVDDELDPLPPADGDEGDDSEDDEEIELDVDDREGNLLDDTTGENDPIEPLEVHGDERGWLDNAAAAEDVDVGGHDFEPEEEALLRDVEEQGVGDEDFGLDDSNVALGDAGEEGFDSDDDELREEDLPRMDADAEHDDGDEVARFWGGGEPEVVLPPWDDRAWERVAHVPDVGTTRVLTLLDSAVIAWGGAWRITLDDRKSVAVSRLEDAKFDSSTTELVATGSAVYSLRGGQLHRAEGERWTLVEGISGATVMIAADGGLLVGIYSPRDDRAWIARVADDGAARVVAELGGEDEDSEPKVLCLAWDAARKVAWAGGGFGVIAFRESGR